jgi:predicted GTPase
VDNAGIRKLQKISESTEKAAVIRTRNLISRLDIVIFVVDASRKITREDLYISRLVEKSAKPVIIAANKWDLVRNQTTANRYRNYIGSRFNRLDYASVLLTSALDRKGLYQILEQILRIFTRLQQPVKTAQVNRMIRELIQERRLYTSNGRLFDPKYTVIESRQPYFFRFHLGTDTRLKAHSEKYLKKRIREVMDLKGIPVFFKSVGS